MIREDAIQAARALFRARYRSLIGIKFYKEWPKREDCRGLHCYFAAWIKFKDEVTGKEHAELLTDVEYHIFEKIREETKNVIWENMIEKLNAYFDETLCLGDDECPKLIEKSEIDFRYSIC